MFFSKLSSESIIISSEVSFMLVVIEDSPIKTSTGIFKLKSKWHFSRLALR